MTSPKIVFPDRSTRLPLDGDGDCGRVWECDLARDTNPQDPRRGALIVRPIRRLTWAWTSVGPELWGARKRDLRCLEYPSLCGSHAPRGDEFFRERDRENAAWAAAVQKQQIWSGSFFDAERFCATFGPPMAVLGTAGGERAVLCYAHGEKEVEARLLAQIWSFTSTGALRRRDAVVEAEFRLDDHPDVYFWDGVGRIDAAHGMPPCALTRLESLTGDHRAAAIALLRAGAPDPEALVRLRWERESQYLASELARLWRDLPLLFLPGAAVRSSRYLGTVSYPESDDGYRAAGSYETWLTRLVLETGSGTGPLGRFVLRDGLERAVPALDAEEERSRLIRESLREIEERLAPRIPAYPPGGEELLDLPAQAWEARCRSAWAILAQSYRQEAAMAAAAVLRGILADAARETEWEVWQQSAPDIEVTQDAVSLPPVVTRDIGRQVAYGVAQVAQAWSTWSGGEAHRTTWYRDASEAAAAHARAAEIAAPLFERRAEELRRESAREDRQATRDQDARACSLPSIASREPPVGTRSAEPAISASVADLRARFNRRR